LNTSGVYKFRDFLSNPLHSSQSQGCRKCFLLMKNYACHEKLFTREIYACSSRLGHIVAAGPHGSAIKAVKGKGSISNGMRSLGKGKDNMIYIVSSCETSKALRHGSHSFTCKLHHVCLYLVSVHQMALPLTCGNIHLIAAYYSSIHPERMTG